MDKMENWKYTICIFQLSILSLRQSWKKIAAREIPVVMAGRSRISVSEHLSSSLEPALSYACPGDVSWI